MIRIATKLFLLIVLIFVLVFCKDEKFILELIFEGTMDNVSITTKNSELVFNGWDELINHSDIDDISLNNLGAVQYAFQEIRTDPDDASKKVLYAQVIDDDINTPSTSRAQLSIGFNDGVNLPIYHTSHRMYLHKDIGHLTNFSADITWFTLFEIWNEHVPTWTGDQAGSARWSLSIHKSKGTGQALFWEIDAQFTQPQEVIFKPIWGESNKMVPIPLGKWFTLDLYMKRGEGANGRMIIKITPDGEATSTLFDIANSTVYPGHPEIQISTWQPFKIYLYDEYLDWMRSNNKVLAAYYNDYKWYKN